MGVAFLYSWLLRRVAIFQEPKNSIKAGFSDVYEL